MCVYCNIKGEDKGTHREEIKKKKKKKRKIKKIVNTTVFAI
jgi:hypothetical protein